MPLDATAAAAAAAAIVTATIDPFLVEMVVAYPAQAATMRAQSLASYTSLITIIYASIVANAVVSPLGVPPLSNGAGAVGGTGKVL